MHALIIAKNASAIRVTVASKDHPHITINPFVSTSLFELHYRDIQERN